MKIVILTDLEGTSGIVGRSNGRGINLVNEQAAADILTDEVNACCEGLLDAGADDITVVDGHGSSCNLDIRKLHPEAQLRQIGWSNPVCYLDSTCDAFLQIGAHGLIASASHLNHTLDCGWINSLQLNGKEIGEIGIAARIAGYFNAPTILVSGCETACQEARELLGEQIKTVPVKKAWGRYSSLNYSHQKVCKALQETAKQALLDLPEMTCPPQEKHYVLRLQVMSPDQAFDPVMRGAKLIDPRTVEFESDDFIDVYAQLRGWAKGVHNRHYGITPDWIFDGF